MNNILIHKYPLAIEETQQVLLPIGAKILDVQLQGSQLVLWAMFNMPNDQSPTFRTIEIITTGLPVAVKRGREYISTVQIVGAVGTLVLHFFENLPYE